MGVDVTRDHGRHMSGAVRAVLIDDYSGVGGVRVGSVPVADPGPGEVCVQVAAAAIGPWDRFTTEGAFAELLGDASQARFPMVLGWDLAGTVIAAGEGSDVAPGTRVLAMTRQPLTGVGAQAQRVTLPADACAELPHGITDADAACLPCCGLTAWQAVDAMGIEDGEEWILVVGATGQLGGLVTQLAVARGLRVIASVRSEEAEAARALGAEHVVDRQQDVAAAVRSHVPAGVLAAFDPVGGAASGPAIAAVADGGRHVRAVTWAQPADERGIETRTLFVQPDRAVLARLAELLADGTITPRPTELVPLDAAPDTYARLAAGTARARLVLAP